MGREVRALCMAEEEGEGCCVTVLREREVCADPLSSRQDGSTSAPRAGPWPRTPPWRGAVDAQERAAADCASRVVRWSADCAGCGAIRERSPRMQLRIHTAFPNWHIQLHALQHCLLGRLPFDVWITMAVLGLWGRAGGAGCWMLVFVILNPSESSATAKSQKTGVRGPKRWQDDAQFLMEGMGCREGLLRKHMFEREEDSNALTEWKALRIDQRSPSSLVAHQYHDTLIGASETRSDRQRRN